MRLVALRVEFELHVDERALGNDMPVNVLDFPPATGKTHAMTDGWNGKGKSVHAVKTVVGAGLSKLCSRLTVWLRSGREIGGGFKNGMSHKATIGASHADTGALGDKATSGDVIVLGPQMLAAGPLTRGLHKMEGNLVGVECLLPDSRSDLLYLTCGQIVVHTIAGE
jgi:hypothetical protein